MAYHLLARCCLLSLLLAPLRVGASMSTAEAISQAYNLVLNMQSHTSTLMQTYLQQQGTPFSDPNFAVPEQTLSTLPSKDMLLETWHNLDDGARLSLTQEAFWSFSQHLHLMQVDQSELNPDSSILQDTLWEARLKAKGLAGNLAGLMTALGVSTPPANGPLGTVPLGDSAFHRKLRGCLIIRDYGIWIDGAVSFLGELKAKYPE